MSKTDPNTTAKVDFNHYVPPAKAPCPSCGHCPTCGRHKPQPFTPWVQPYTYPYYTYTSAY